MFGTAQRIGIADSPLTENMYASTETEEELRSLEIPDTFLFLKHLA
jgi:hypothetical protein